MRTDGAPVLGAGVTLILLTAGGCGGSGSAEAGPSTPPAPSASASSARPTPPEDLCTRLVAHWSREVLDEGTYGDYQSMGLSNGQYDILREVVDAARAEKRRQGARAADELIAREARRGCVARYRDGGPREGPWN